MSKSFSIEDWDGWMAGPQFRELLNILQRLKEGRLEEIVTASDRDAIANQVIGIDDAIRQILALKGEQDD